MMKQVAGISLRIDECTQCMWYHFRLIWNSGSGSPHFLVISVPFSVPMFSCLCFLQLPDTVGFLETFVNLILQITVLLQHSIDSTFIVSSAEGFNNESNNYVYRHKHHLFVAKGLWSPTAECITQDPHKAKSVSNCHQTSYWKVKRAKQWHGYPVSLAGFCSKLGGGRQGAACIILRNYS